MSKLRLRDIFKNQLNQIYRFNQDLTYLYITAEGYTEVRTVNHWRVQSLLYEHSFLESDQKAILPVFRSKDCVITVKRKSNEKRNS
ncbi:hypothetical protein UFOVP116_150 [uncultured Caudovirales phage]|uniref:Uncharacterized protein n=1 Tax=uncultured Caudovirales phage TaxID=2100421 RepID=A0A6J5L655_9CAUD|nr:hypothetical protein UFOVP116_150 [uncultured Caudovirales phage]